MHIHFAIELRLCIQNKNTLEKGLNDIKNTCRKVCLKPKMTNTNGDTNVVNLQMKDYFNRINIPNDIEY